MGYVEKKKIPSVLTLLSRPTKEKPGGSTSTSVRVGPIQSPIITLSYPVAMVGGCPYALTQGGRGEERPKVRVKGDREKLSLNHSH